MSRPRSAPPQLKVAHVTSVHVVGDTRIVHKECRSLLEAGYEVVLIIPGPVPSPLPGLGIRWVPGSSGRLARMTTTAVRILGACLRERADVYHLHDPELIPVGLVLKLSRKRVIYDSHEHLPRQIANKEWIPKGLRKPVARAAALLEKVADRAFDGIVVANPSTTSSFNPTHTALVENFARVEADAHGTPPRLRDRKVSVAYVGGLAPHRGLSQMIDAVRFLDRPTEDVVLAGPVDPAVDGKVLASAPANIRFPGRVSRQEADALLLSARIGLSVLQPVPNFTEGHYPTKLFEYMAAGMPVVASDFPLYRRVVQDAGCGLLVDPLVPRAIAEAMAYLLDHPDEAQVMADRGHVAVLEKYTWAVAERELLRLYRAIIRGRPES